MNNKSLTLLAASLAISLTLPVVSTALARTTNCKIKVVGGSYKGRSFPVKMVDGSFVGASGMLASNLPGCRVKKNVYGRWYHLCAKGTLIVYKFKDNRWKLLKPKSLKKYRHTCF